MIIASPVPVRSSIHDVTRRCGSCMETESRVPDGDRGETGVSGLAALAGLGTKRDPLASEPRSTQPAAVVGVIIDNLSDPCHGTMLQAMEAVARENDAMLLIATSGQDPNRQRELVENLVSRALAGLLIVSVADHHPDLALALERGLAVVFVDRAPLDVACDAVVVDNERGAADGVAHLLSHGHTRIGLVGGDERTHTVETRRAGYHRALEAAAVPTTSELLRLGCHQASEATAAAHDLLDLADPPTAIFATDNLATVGVLRAVRSRNAQVAILGFDGFELADLLSPQVRFIANDPSGIGELAARRLFMRIRSRNSPPEVLQVPPRLLA